MILTFTIEIEVEDHLGEKQVPYLKELLLHRISHVGYPKVKYENWLTDKDKRSEEIEKQAFYAGETDI